MAGYPPECLEAAFLPLSMEGVIHHESMKGALVYAADPRIPHSNI